jgi:hypothetical protein
VMQMNVYAMIMIRDPRSSAVSGCSAGLSGIAAIIRWCGGAVRPCRNSVP